jgi:predicted nucleic acid-binding protein
MQIIMDTSCIVGLIDRGCKKHDQIRKIVTDEHNEIIIPSPVIPEVCYMLNKRFGPEVELRFIDDIAGAELQVEVLEFKDVLRVPEIIRKYRSLNMGFVDAAVTAIAERLGINKLLTLDNRHFNAVVPIGFDCFDVLI